MKESDFLEGHDYLVEKLRLIPAFAEFDDERIKALLRVSKIQTYEAHETIIQEGLVDNRMYILIAGSVKITKEGRLILRLRRSGDIFGEMSMLDIRPRTATVISLQQSTCLAIDAARLEELRDVGHDSFHAAIYRMFAQILAYRLRVTTEQYLEVKRELDQLKRDHSSPTSPGL